MLDVEIDNKFDKLLETYTKHKPATASPPMTMKKFKDRMISLLNITQLAGKTTHITFHHTNYSCTYEEFFAHTKLIMSASHFNMSFR